jgi:hypothetical protein
MRVYGGSDYAVTNDGDWTVHAVIGVDPDSRLWLLDVWRGQTASDQWIEAFCDLALQWRPIGWAEEHGQIKAGVGPFLERRMPSAGRSSRVIRFRPVGTRRCGRNRSEGQGNRISKSGQQAAEKGVVPSRSLELSAQRSFRSLLLKYVHRHMT